MAAAGKATEPWGKQETEALLEAWVLLHRRRREARGDPWVSEDECLRHRCSSTLFAEDWRAVAGPVNAARASSGLTTKRTPEQCKVRMSNLKSRYKREISKAEPSQWLFFPVLDAIHTEERWPAWRRRTQAADGREAHEHHPQNVVGGGAHEQEERGGAALADVHGNASNNVGRIPKRQRSVTLEAEEHGSAAVDGIHGAAAPRLTYADTVALMVTRGLDIILKCIEADQDSDVDAATVA